MIAESTSPRYSVVVPAYRAAATIGACLEALAQQTVSREHYEIIVVDDGSPDGTGEIARRAGVQVLPQAHAGAAAARNNGAAAARGELLLFTDADCSPVSDWIAALTAPFEDPGVAGAKGAYLTRQRGILPRFTQLEYEDRYDRMAGAKTIDFIDTYSAAYRRDVFAANQGFDTGFLIDEDQEFSFRLAEKGYRLVFAPQARVYHVHNPTIRAYVRRKFLIGFWKVRVTRQHPDRAVRDSHTPQVLKAQIVLLFAVLLGLSTAALAGGLRAALWRPALGAAAGAALVFLLTGLPFLAKIWRRDRGVFLPALGLLWVRALALGSGFALGLLWPHGWRSRDRPTLSAAHRTAKRLLDIMVSLAGLPLVALPIAVMAVAIKLDSPGPVFFTQVRIGQGGRPFRILKLRTMVQGAEEMLAQLVDIGALAQPAFKLAADPRVTRVGRVLRRWSLDELPQLINVLRGEMSLVGPRPEEAALVERYTDDQRCRLAVKPGMTGPMQISGRGDLMLHQRLALELDYIERYSLRRDLAILLRTIPAVIRGAGAY